MHGSDNVAAASLPACDDMIAVDDEISHRSMIQHMADDMDYGAMSTEGPEEQYRIIQRTAVEQMTPEKDHVSSLIMEAFNQDGFMTRKRADRFRGDLQSLSVKTRMDGFYESIIKPELLQSEASVGYSCSAAQVNPKCSHSLACRRRDANHLLRGQV